MKKVFKMQDLDCANCAAKMERAIAQIDGVQKVTISFLAQKMTIEADDARFDEIVRQACDIAYRTFELGWDQEFGGVQLFCDMEGGAPKGDISDTSDEPMVKKVTADWGSKLWWVHSETLYTSLLCYKITGEHRFMDMYEKAADYTFRIFPEKDPEIGEWIQIHDRTGAPESRVVALPVKDPFHIIRNVFKIIELY